MAPFRATGNDNRFTQALLQQVLSCYSTHWLVFSLPSELQLVRTCRSVGVRLGRGEALADILASSNQVAEGVSTAGVVVSLARTYRVSLPVLTAVAQVSMHS